MKQTMRRLGLTGLMVLFTIVSGALPAKAVYSNGPANAHYNRTAAAQYVYNYASRPNPAYANFRDYGGDCTNFASQVLRAGGMQMTARKASPTTADWYYYGSAWGTGRTSTWTQAHSFRMYWADVNGVGQKKAYEWKKFTREELGNYNTYYNQVYKYLEPGDIVQYYYGGTTRHSQVVHRTSYEGGEYKVSMGQHSDTDSGFGWRKLWQYIQDKPQGTIICLIKIKKPGSGTNGISDAAVMSHQSLSSMSLEELLSEEDLLFNWSPDNENDENAKWERLASIKQEVGDRTFDETSEFKLKATKDELLEFIDGRLDFDSICLSGFGQISYDRDIIQKPLDGTQTLGVNKPGSSQIINMVREIEEIKAFRNTVLDCSEDQVEELWNQYWGEILKQDAPSCYVFE